MLDPKAAVDGYPVVCSVWHSGTRTLVKWLSEELNTSPAHHHFSHFDSQLRGQYGRHPHLVHVTVRHPMSIAESWARRGRPIDKLLVQFESMWAYLERYEPHLHVMEALPRLEGLNDHDVVRDKPVAAVAEYQQIVRDEVVEPHRAFWDQYYVDPTSAEDRSIKDAVRMEV